MPNITENVNTILNSGYASVGNAPNFNKFSFYSGSQITVWFGNILIDDIVSIQWQRMQNKRPIYGYASQKFDAVAKGTVLIQGNFVVNFRQSGYLSLVMGKIEQIYNGIENKQNWPEIRKFIGYHLKNGTFGPQTAEEIMDLGNSDDFTTRAKAYEDIMWGTGIPGDPELPVTSYPPDVKQANDIPDGFNILVTYGNTATKEARTLNEYLQSTTKTIVGVHLVGESQVIQVGGQAVMEQYDFIAQGTDEYVGTTR